VYFRGVFKWGWFSQWCLSGQDESGSGGISILDPHISLLAMAFSPVSIRFTEVGICRYYRLGLTHTEDLKMSVLRITISAAD